MGLYDDAVALANHQFVGRRDEIARFEAVLNESQARVWWVFGPGGIGKSSLLSVLADQARASGCRVVALDLRLADGSRQQLTSVFDTSGDVDNGQDRRTVVLLDGLDPARAIEGWLRSELLPNLPSEAVVLVGSRLAPSLDLRCDAGLSSVLELVPLRGLPPPDGRELLQLAGVTPESAWALEELGHGHPMALRLLADITTGQTGGTVPHGIEEVPDLVAALLKRMIADASSEGHRQAVELAAVARVTTRSMVRAIGDPEQADTLFEWLAERPWIDRIPGGLRPHDLARDVIMADLHNNDPDRHASIVRSVRHYILDADRLAQDPLRCARDYLYLHRHRSVLNAAWDWASLGRTDPTPVRPADRDVIADLVARCYGPASVAALDHWLARQPQAFTVLRSAEGVTGFITLIVLDEPTPEDLAADPSLAACWRRAHVRGRPRAGETLGLFRFVCDADAGTVPPSPTYNAVTVRSAAYWLTHPGLSLDYIVKPKNGTFKPMMDYADFHAVADAEHMVGDTPMVVYEHDWRDVPLGPWLDRMEALEAGGPIIPATDSTPTLVAMDEATFTDAVRSALRDLSRPDRLADNPLFGSRVVRDASNDHGPDALITTVREAFSALDEHPRTERARRAVDRTYLRGAVTQEAAAEVLDMAFSTYRRHLATGVGLLVDQLWRWELYGRSD